MYLYQLHDKKWKWSALDDDEKDFAFSYLRAQIRRLEADLEETNAILRLTVPEAGPLSKQRLQNRIKRASNEEKKSMGPEGPLPPIAEPRGGGKRRSQTRRRKQKSTH